MNYGYCRQCDKEIEISEHPDDTTYEGYCDEECKAIYAVQLGCKSPRHPYDCGCGTI